MDDAATTFSRSLPQLALLGLAALVMAGGSAIVAFGSFPSRFGPEFPRLIGWLGMLFFGLGVVVAIRRALASGPVVEISRAGIRDRRLSPDLVPWTDVTGIAPRQVKRQKMLQIDLTPAAEARLTRPGAAGLLNRMNEAMGFRGLLVTMTGLQGSFDDLVAAVQRATGPASPNDNAG